MTWQSTVVAAAAAVFAYAILDISITLNAIFQLLTRWERRRDKHGQP